MKSEATERPTESMYERLHYCRTMLAIADVLTESENGRVFRRIDKNFVPSGHVRLSDDTVAKVTKVTIHAIREAGK